ncbi:MAG: hypothetical protein KDK08_25825, partial [Rhizobiaceae bacterium]|nr:hypothetical protein [Rhizobiaceae bacterium]
MSERDLNSSTFLSTHGVRATPTVRLFGWNWRITEDLSVVASKLAARGIIFNVWDTPQLKAIEWLTGAPLIQPDQFDPVFHDLFFRIMGLYLHLAPPASRSEMARVAEISERAMSKLRELIDEINSTPKHVLNLFAFSTAADDTVRALQAWEQVKVFATGYPEIETTVREKFFGDNSQKPPTGRPLSWPSLLVTMYAADIYLTFTGNNPD